MLSKRLICPSLIVATLFIPNQSNAMEQKHVSGNPFYSAPLRIAQKMVAVACRPLGYDQASRLPLDPSLQLVSTSLSQNPSFKGLLIDPCNRARPLIESIDHDYHDFVFHFPISTIVEQASVENSMFLNIQTLNQRLQAISRIIIIIHNIEKLAARTPQSDLVCTKLNDVMQAVCVPARAVSVVGLSDNLTMVPNILRDYFSLVLRLPTMLYDERRQFLSEQLAHTIPPRVTQEWQNLLPINEEYFLQLDREQFVGALSQLTEGYSQLALDQLVANIQAIAEGQREGVGLDQVVHETTQRFNIMQTLGSRIILKPLSYVSRPSLWLRSYALMSEGVSVDSRIDILNIANQAQYGERRPTFGERARDLVISLSPVLINLAIRKSVSLVIGYYRK